MTISVQLPSKLPGALAAVAQPSDTELALVQRLESGRAALPVLPAVAASALQLANNPDASLQKFAELIETDPPMAARFLSVANSAYYSRGIEVTEVRVAVTRIGLFASRDLLFQVVYASTTRGLPRFQHEVEQSFKRSVMSGLICRAACDVLSKRFREAYLCGLLHDIGESRVYRILCELERKLGKTDAAEAEDLVRRYHARAGGELAQKWQLPKDIVDACLKHHEQRPPESDGVLLVRVADLAIPCVEALQRGEDFDRPEEPLETLGISAQQFVRIVEQGRVLIERGAGI